MTVSSLVVQVEQSAVEILCNFMTTLAQCILSQADISVFLCNTEHRQLKPEYFVFKYLKKWRFLQIPNHFRTQQPQSKRISDSVVGGIDKADVGVVDLPQHLLYLGFGATRSAAAAASTASPLAAQQ